MVRMDLDLSAKRLDGSNHRVGIGRGEGMLDGGVARGEGGEEDGAKSVRFRGRDDEGALQF